MSVATGLILFILSILILCVLTGLWIGLTRQNKKIDFKLTCVCGEDEFDENELLYLCKSCGKCYEK